MASKYILVISKIVPKNNNKFKLINLESIDTQDTTCSTGGNVLAVDVNDFQPTGIKWNFESNTCSINSDLIIGGHIFLNSDIRLKKDINNIINPMLTINKIQGVLFNWIDTLKHDYGVIAQLLLKILPLGVTLQLGLKKVNYIMLIPFLLLSIKLLNNKVLQLQRKILEIKK